MSDDAIIVVMCSNSVMTSTEEVRMIRVPEWDLTDRLRKSLRVAGLNTTEMAEYLGVQRTTINTWTSGRIKPSIATLRAWAMATGVPFEWLRDGGLYDSASGGVRHQGLEPRTR